MRQQSKDSKPQRHVSEDCDTGLDLHFRRFTFAGAASVRRIAGRLAWSLDLPLTRHARHKRNGDTVATPHVEHNRAVEILRHNLKVRDSLVLLPTSLPLDLYLLWELTAEDKCSWDVRSHIPHPTTIFANGQQNVLDHAARLIYRADGVRTLSAGP